MTSVERPSESTQPETQNQLGELAHSALTNLRLLAAFAPMPPDISTTKQGYEDYINSNRYRGAVATRTDAITDHIISVTPGVLLNARHLQAEAQEGWELNLFTSGDDLSPERGVAASRYLLDVTLCRDGQQQPLKIVTLDYADGADGNDGRTPRLTQWERYGLTRDRVVVDDSEIEGSYAFRVLTQITEQLQREADALLSLALDDIAA